jgi:hypothetical protein
MLTPASDIVLLKERGELALLAQSIATVKCDFLFAIAPMLLHISVRFPRKSRHPTIRLEGRLEGCQHGSNPKEVHAGVQN